MRQFVLLSFLSMAAVVIGAAQQPTPRAAESPAEFEILKLKWEKVIPLPRDNDWPSAERDAAPIYRPPLGRRGGGGFSRQRAFYLYSMRLKNTGAKKLKAVAWEYYFLDPATKKELGRQRLLGYKKIGVNKTETVESASPTPPTKVVTVAGLEKNKRSPFEERAVILCALYDDGTQWLGPGGTERDCDALRRAEKRRPRNFWAAND
jgi:hypothetical protein